MKYQWTISNAFICETPIKCGASGVREEIHRDHLRRLKEEIQIKEIEAFVSTRNLLLWKVQRLWAIQVLYIYLTFLLFLKQSEQILSMSGWRSVTIIEINLKIREQNWAKSNFWPLEMSKAVSKPVSKTDNERMGSLPCGGKWINRCYNEFHYRGNEALNRSSFDIRFTL